MTERNRSMKMAFSVDTDLWGHLRFVSGKNDSDLLRCALACYKWAIDQSQKGYQIGSYDECGIASTLTDDSFDRIRPTSTPRKVPDPTGSER